MIAVTGAVHAQTATIAGFPANFDAAGDTGEETHGFEIEADRLQPSDLTRVFGGVQSGCVIRYCTGSIVPLAGGVHIRWVNPYDPVAGQFTRGTPLPNGTVASGENCWTWGPGSRGIMRLMQRNIPISRLAYILSGNLGVPVEDKTGLQGTYSIALEWRTDEDLVTPGAAPVSPVDASAGAAAAALRALGLNLAPGKGPVEVLVIDHAEKPAAN